MPTKKKKLTFLKTDRKKVRYQNKMLTRSNGIGLFNFKMNFQLAKQILKSSFIFQTKHREAEKSLQNVWLQSASGSQKVELN